MTELDVGSKLTAEMDKTHPGFTITCNKCKSPRVYVENTLGYSSESGSWGEVTLICDDYGKRCDIVG